VAASIIYRKIDDFWRESCPKKKKSQTLLNQNFQFQSKDEYDKKETKYKNQHHIATKKGGMTDFITQKRCK
jgi:hypothetical protein